MARDYKNSSTAKRQKPERPLGSWTSFFSGLFLGLLVALGVYVWRDKVPSVENAPIFSSTEPIEYEKQPGETLAPVSAPAKKPKFDFYNILPEIEVKVPDWEITRTPEDERDPLESGTYVFQVGSFKQHDDADRAKAELALAGIQAKIHRVVINGQDVWYRVHVGPFHSSSAVQAMRKKLIGADRDFIVLRMGED